MRNDYLYPDTTKEINENSCCGYQNKIGTTTERTYTYLLQFLMNLAKQSRCQVTAAGSIVLTSRKISMSPRQMRRARCAYFAFG